SGAWRAEVLSTAGAGVRAAQPGIWPGNRLPDLHCERPVQRASDVDAEVALPDPRPTFIVSRHDQRSDLLQPLWSAEFGAGEVLLELRNSVYRRSSTAESSGSDAPRARTG